MITSTKIIDNDARVDAASGIKIFVYIYQNVTSSFYSFFPVEFDRSSVELSSSEIVVISNGHGTFAVVPEMRWNCLK